MPAPAIMGLTSMGTEVLGGLALVLGLFLRPAAVLLVGNFVVALLLLQRHHPYAKAFESLQMLAVVLTVLFTGPGPLSLDALLQTRRHAGGPQLTERASITEG